MKLHLVCALGLSLIALTTASAETVWLDSLDVRSATQGWGEPHRNKSVEGHPLSIGGKTFERGFGTHAESILHIAVNGGAKAFSASVGVDDDVNHSPASSLEFIVIGDGKELWKSGVMHADNAAKECAVDLSGVKMLTLKVSDAGDGNDYDHADWVDAKIEPWHPTS
jgi:alpha-galactosidase